jgi:hypothetical protein
VHRRQSTQVFEGAADLDIPPAAAGEITQVGRVWCDAGFPIEVHAETAASHLGFSVSDPGGDPVPLHHGVGHTNTRGWHAIVVASTAATDTPFRVAVTYMAPQFL